MFLSKIWFFLIALAGAIALTVALVLPRPAQREAVTADHNRLAVACGIVDILLTDDARNRVDLAGNFGRAPEIVTALEAASNADKLDDNRMKQVRDIGEKLMKGISGHTPDFAMLIDRRGRVVARVHLDDGDFGDLVAGRPLVDDALAGYLRDDLWTQNGTMYFVSAAPVVKRDPPVAYVGAVVLGHKVTNDFATVLRTKAAGDIDVGFYVGAEDVAASRTMSFDHSKLVDALKGLTGNDIGRDCQANQPFELHVGNDDYTTLVARLPGEAQSHQAYYAVMTKKPEARGFMGTLHAVRQGDLAFKSFPWLLVGGGFLLALALGIGLMFVEADRPLRGLAADAVRLAKGDAERLGEDKHAGKFGSIARSVNIHIDKLGRDAKSARTNLDSLLGPAPAGGLGTIDLLAGALPAARPGGDGPSVPPPPSDFRFGDATPVPAPASPVAAAAARPTPPPVRAVTPPPVRLGTPPPAPPVAAPLPPVAPVDKLDDDILGAAIEPEPEPAPADGEGGDPYFKQVFEQFVAVKKSCNENTAGLTFQKFSEKLVKNRDDLMAKTGCKEVRFTVYVKDGKAALKATPVKEEA